MNPSRAPLRHNTSAILRLREPVSDSSPPEPIVTRAAPCTRRQLASTRCAAATEPSTNASELSCCPRVRAAEAWITTPPSSPATSPGSPACSCARAAPGLARTAAKPSVVKSDAEKTIDVDAYARPGASRASTVSASANGIRRAGALRDIDRPMLPDSMIDIEAQLADLDASSLLRRTRLVGGPQGPQVELDGEPVLLLCSNDYLGLAAHPRVREAAAAAAMSEGVGAGASRLVSGTMRIHEELEQRLAAFEHRERALLFGSGYLANIGVVSSLAGRAEVVFSDELNHASIIDGCRLSRAEVFVYRHRDLDHLAWGIARAGDRGALIVTDSVFSMDGDLAPLQGVVELARRHGLRVAVDEAHGTGTLGPGGRGALAAAGLAEQVDVIVGTLSKALGCYGAFVACNASMARFLLNTARPFIFSTALPVPVAAAALAALTVLEEEPQLVQALAANAAVLREELGAQGLHVESGESPIVPLIVGEASAAMEICERTLARGVFAQAIRPPTVLAGTSRLRMTVMATHSPEQLRAAARVVGETARMTGEVGRR